MTEHKKSGFWDRALRNMRGAWDKIASDTGETPEVSVTPGLSDDDRLHLIEHMQACLDARGGEVSARKRAAALGHAYLSLNEDGRKKFLNILAGEFDTDGEATNEAVSNLLQTLFRTSRASLMCLWQMILCGQLLLKKNRHLISGTLWTSVKFCW